MKLRKLFMPGSIHLLAIGTLIVVSAASGCATPTGYQRASVWNDNRGWRDKPIGPDEYSVIVQGNPQTTAERAASIALLRAAHLTLENERERFEVFEAEAVRRTQEVTTNVPLRSGGMTVFVPVDKHRTSEPVAVLLVRLRPAGAGPDENSLDAREVIATLGPTFD
jgi:hypothetical protein